MTIKEQLIQEIEQAPEEFLIELMQLWQLTKQKYTKPVKISPAKLSEFFRQSPLVEVAATGELDLSRDRSPLSPDRFIP
jgi:hypothetical protein